MNLVVDKVVSVFSPFDLHLIGKRNHMADLCLQQMGIAFENTLAGDRNEIVPCFLFLGLLRKQSENFVFKTWRMINLHLLIDLHMP